MRKRHEEGASYVTIGEEMNCSPGSVRIVLKRTAVREKPTI
jgi:DNA-directed RNA polymerase specialized sigma24 family protein